MSVFKMISLIIIIGFCIEAKYGRPLDVVGVTKAPEVKQKLPAYKVEPGIIDEVIDQAAAHWGINPAILHALAEVESSKNPKAVAKEGNGTRSWGLMQINDVYAKDEKTTGEQLTKDAELAAHLGAKRIAHFCKARINKAVGIKNKLLVADGCYRGSYKSERLFSHLQKTGKLKTIKSIWG